MENTTRISYMHVCVFILMCLIIVWKYKCYYGISIINPISKIGIKNNNLLGIITYNVNMMPFIDHMNIDQLYQFLRKYDICLLQECYINAFYNNTTLCDKFKNFYIVHSGVNRLLNIKLIDSGLIILSKYPIIKKYFKPFDNYKLLTTDMLADKGFINVKIKVGSNIISIYNTHLQASYINHENRDVSKEQLKYLLSFYNSDTSFIKIIGGDFNLLPKHISNGSKKIYPKTNTYSQNNDIYDYFIVNMINNHSIKCINNVCLSDHYPVELYITL